MIILHILFSIISLPLLNLLIMRPVMVHLYTKDEYVISTTLEYALSKLQGRFYKKRLSALWGHKIMLLLFLIVMLTYSSMGMFIGISTNSFKESLYVVIGVFSLLPLCLVVSLVGEKVKPLLHRDKIQKVNHELLMLKLTEEKDYVLEGRLLSIRDVKHSILGIKLTKVEILYPGSTKNLAVFYGAPFLISNKRRKLLGQVAVVSKGEYLNEFRES